MPGRSAARENVLQQILAIWQSLDMRRRIIVIGATLATFAAILALSNMATKPSLSLLYAGLSGDSAGQVLASLDQHAVTYEVRGDSIYVDGSRRDELRMSLAAEGLPATGGAGYELLDNLSGFGTTSQMFDAAYWRAKEGELARTIAANPQIRSARVHIANQVSQGLRPALKATASVTVTTRSGGLPVIQAKALKFLIASAVSGMQPDDVAVIDSVAGLIQTSDEAGSDGQGSDRANALRANVQRLLEARVGPGKVVVELSVDTNTEREQITEKKLDPQGRVAISSDTEEKKNSTTDSRGNAVTVASNLPSGNGAGTNGQSQSQGNETRERTNFDVSQTTREVLRAPGEIRRITVAVLIDGVTTTDAAGTVSWAPRPEDEMAALKELVASAVGFSEQRGDVITLKTMPFEPPAVSGTLVEPGIFDRFGLEAMKLIQLGVLAVVAVVTGLFVLRPILTRPVPQLPPPFPGLAPPLNNALTGEIDDGPFAPGELPVMAAAGLVGGDIPALGRMGDGFAADDPVARLRRLIDDRKDETVEILRGWIEDAEGERA